MNEEFLEAFCLLDKDEKRNQVSNELMVIGELINSVKTNLGLQEFPVSIKNYDGNVDGVKTEDEMLTFFYEDIYNIEKELITLFACMSSLRDNE